MEKTMSTVIGLEVALLTKKNDGPYHFGGKI